MDRNKNKTGFFDGVSYNSIQQNVNMSNQDSHSPVNRLGDHSECMTFDSVVDVKQANECKLLPYVSDRQRKPRLALQKIKIKSGLWMSSMQRSETQIR